MIFNFTSMRHFRSQNYGHYIPLTKKKTVGPLTTLEYLGVILDTVKLNAILCIDNI